MLPTALPALQTGVYVALTGNAPYMALCAAVYDAVPQKPLYPHTVIGDAIETSDRTMGQNGHEVYLTCSIITQDGGSATPGRGSKGFAAALAIAKAQIDILVETSSVTATGTTIVFAEVESVETIREPDGVTRRVDVNYRVLVEDDA